MLDYIYTNRDYFFINLKGIVALIWIEVNALAMYITSISVIEITNLLGLISLLGGKIMILKLSEVHYILQKSLLGPGQLLATRLFHFRREHTSAALLIVQIDDVEGTLFLYYLCAMVPMSVSLTLATFFVRAASFEERLYSFIILMTIESCFVCMHLMVAMFPEKIHNPIKLLFPLLSSGRFRAHSRDYLCLSHYLEVFHTKSPYGITYGHLGLITMFSFVKFNKAYIEFILFTAQIFRNAGWL